MMAVMLALFIAAGSFALGTGLAKPLGCLIPFSLLFIAFWIVRRSIGSIPYDAATMTVTLHPARALNFHYRYKLIVAGTSPTALTNLQGSLLDGNADGISRCHLN